MANAGAAQLVQEENEPFGARIGANVLDTLTTGMYTNPLDTVREYVANARDAIVTATDRGLIPVKHPGRIQVSIDTRRRALTIRDEGIGLPVASAYQRLVDVGMSEKSLDRENNRTVGFRGIGRLAGIAYCDTLEFRTSAVGESIETVVRFDCAELRRGIRNTSRNPETEAVALLNACTTTETAEAKTGEHYFQVRMEGIGEEVGKDLLNNETLRDYLSQNAPVGLDRQKMIYKDEIVGEGEKVGIEIPVMKIIIERDGSQSDEVFRPYKSWYRTAKGSKDEKIEIQGIDYLTPITPGLKYWGWVGRSNLLGQISDPLSSGIRIRKQGIGFGDAGLMSEIFRRVAATSERFNHWYIGEIHIFHSDVIPNGRRDGFEEMEAWTAIQNDLLEHARKLSKQCRDASEVRNFSPEKAQQKAEKVHVVADNILKAGVAAPDTKEELVGKIDKTKQKIEADRKKAISRFGPEQSGHYDKIIRGLDDKRKKIQQVKFAATDMEAGLSRAQVQILRLVLEAAQETLDDGAYAKVRAAIEAKLKTGRVRNMKAKSPSGNPKN